MSNEKQQSLAARQFAKRWAGRGYEKGESQLFWTELLAEVFGIENPSEFIRFEEQVKIDKTNFIDVHIPATKVIIEQKSLGKDLRKPITQSDRTKLTPFRQAKRYSAELPYSQRPRWIVACNFEEFLIYDMERPDAEPEQVLLADLGRDWSRLRFLVDVDANHISREVEISLRAGEIIARIHDALLPLYDERDNDALRALNILCVRLVFCLYCEDAGIFARDQFHDYLAGFETAGMRNALRELFEVLNTPVEQRSRFLPDRLAAFPYTNGGIFAEVIDIPPFDDNLREVLLKNASLDFDWSEISPTIFGGVFESTLNPVTRREGGMHYTSVENIHKVIDPLFLDEFRDRFRTLAAKPKGKARDQALRGLQDRLASLTFLDPACGSGNFLTETYISLRRLENDIIRLLAQDVAYVPFEDFNPIKVSIHQMHGIEINDFAVAVATTALWISEAQMMAETERIINRDIDFLPIRSYANIREGNALRMDWDLIDLPDDDTVTIYADHAYANVIESDKQVVSEPELHYGNINLITPHLEIGTAPAHRRIRVRYDYIISNPPFSGARVMTAENKADLIHTLGRRWQNVGNLDFVAGWYVKAARLMRENPSTRAAMVSTNSVTQGAQVAALWQPLARMGVHIDFAYRTFRWDSESMRKAHVHCVIIGFSCGKTEGGRRIFDGGQVIMAEHINPYLMAAPDVFIPSRQKSLCQVPEIRIGNLPIDGGNYLFEREQMEDFIKKEPASAPYFHPWYGAVEFINQRPRYCLWLGDCTPAQLRAMPHCMKLIEAVRNMRLQSRNPGTRKLADRPTRFHCENMPASEFIVVPRVSSERRKYIPIGYLKPDNLCSDAVHIIPDATLYHFGVLTSSVHMAWTRVVCGRLESRFRYSKDIVYNNFPWPEPTEAQRERIGRTAQAILDARAGYPDSSLADLYDPLTMPADLRQAHADNDRAVAEAYGLPSKPTDDEIVVALFKRYLQLTQQ